MRQGPFVAGIRTCSARPARRRAFVVAIATVSALGFTSMLSAQSGTIDSPQRALWRDLQKGDRGDAPGGSAPKSAPGYRSIDGTGNNLAHPDWGAANTDYLREASGAYYADGLSAPAGENRPSGREISNVVVDQGDLETEDDQGLSTAIYEFGQFLDHDFGLAKEGSTEAFDIEVPLGDPWFDPTGTGTQLIYLDRNDYDPTTGTMSPRQQVNTITAFIDASQVYGSDPVRAAWLRTFSGGKLKTSAGDLLPFNDGTLANANPVGLPATSLYVAGDVRANEQPGLTVLHVVFVREHNRIAGKLKANHPTWGDEKLYQEARRRVGAEMQVITYEEFLPALLGHKLPKYTGYKESVNAGLSNVFATAAYRFGHSQVGPDIGIVDENFVEVDEVDLADAFFNPDVIPDVGGIDPIVRYFAINPSEQVDSMIVGPLRNFLFGPPGSGGFDLASLNIQRGRDHGLPDYNTVRQDFGLPPVTSFGQITSDTAKAAKLEQLYGSVDDVDAWVGLLAEDHVPGSSLGPTHAAVLTDQFTRLRDGDRYWYEIDGFSWTELSQLKKTRLEDVLERNSDAEPLQPQVFFTPCPADFNHTGTVNSNDLFAYLKAWSDKSTAADFDESGTVDLTDLLAFLQALQDGC